MDDLVAIARVARPRGVKGEVVADVLTDFPDRFVGLESVIAVSDDGSRSDLRIENFWFMGGRIVLKFADIDSIESAEAIRNSDICIPEQDAVELETDTFYEWQLEGCEVSTVSGEVLGRVAGLMRTGGTDLLKVSGGDKDYLIPFAEAICTSVDIENKLIRIDPPDGLLDL